MSNMTGVIVVRNRQSVAVSVVIEPWGEERVLLPTQEAKVRYSSAAVGEIAIEASPGYISIYAWVEPECVLEFVDAD